VAEDALFELVLEAGADDAVDAGSTWEVTTSVEDFEPVRKAVEDAGMAPSVVELTLIADNEVALDAEGQKKVLSLMEALDDHDDVQNVYAAFTPSEEVLGELAGG
jgi:transcriptional/translational regulatory protein YebC/TACO1